MEFHCAQCDNGCEQLEEGICAKCHADSYARLFEHNYRFGEWERLTPAEREDRIRQAMN